MDKKSALEYLKKMSDRLYDIKFDDGQTCCVENKQIEILKED